MMHYMALATDFDGTIAHDGVVDGPTLAALKQLRGAARRVILVTGRELDDLQRVMPEIDVFDLVVAENGALLYRPETREERPLVAPPDPRFVERLRELQVEPLSVGRSIVATWEPNETKVLQAIQELGLELTITFNKGAVMVLPSGVNKASGLAAALAELDLAPLNSVAVGDAENDMAFLDIAGCAVAVANATEALKERVVWVTDGIRGDGVQQLITRLLKTDLAELDARLPRQTVELAEPESGPASGEAVRFAPHRETVLLAGRSGGGKSTLTQGFTERLSAAGFQFCLIDPEGDYEGLEHAVSVGAPDQPPTTQRIGELLRKTDTSVAVNLLGVKPTDRPAFFAAMLPELMQLRAQLGRPHVLIVDEAHHLLPAEWEPGRLVPPEALTGCFLITTRPEAVSSRLLPCVDRLLVVGEEPRQTVQAFCAARDLPVPKVPDSLALGEMLVLDTAAGEIARMKVIPGESPRVRHRRKYAEGKLGEDRSFWFRGPEARLNLRARNLVAFMELGEGVGPRHVAVAPRAGRLLALGGGGDQGPGTGGRCCRHRAQRSPGGRRPHRAARPDRAALHPAWLTMHLRASADHGPARSSIAANPVSVPKASCLPSGLQASAETGLLPGRATGTIRAEPISAMTTSPSENPAATISSLGWQASRVQRTPGSPPASSVGALPIGPPPKNGHNTTASAPLLASHLPLRVNPRLCVFDG